MTATMGVTTDLVFALVPEWLLDAEVSAQAIRLYAVLSRYADQEGRSYPSRKLLADRLQVKAKDTVDRALKELTEVGAVTVRGRADEAGDQTSNEYVVHRANPAKGGRTDAATPPVEEGEGVAAQMRPPGRTGSTTGPQGSGDGGRTDAATVAAQILHEREPLEREPTERTLLLVGDAAEDTSDDEPSRPDVDRLCTQLADRIEANGSKRPTITKAWRTQCRLLLDRDQRTEDQVARAIDWCQADPFWSTNVLSMPTLRKQYDRLRLAAQRERTSPRRGDIDWDAAMARAQAREAADQVQALQAASTATVLGEVAR